MPDYFVNLGGRPVVELRLAMPRVGAWWAQLALADNDSPPTGLQALSLNGFSLSCTVKRSSVFAGAPTALVIGGAARLDTMLSPKSYRQQTLKLILGDILGAAGETVSSSSDAQVLGTIIPSWVTAARKAGQGLSSLVDYVDGAVWRFAPDGTVWIGTETWPAAQVDSVEVLDSDIVGQKMTVFAPTPSFLPGQTFDGNQIDYVEHRLRDGVLRTDLSLIFGGLG